MESIECKKLSLEHLAQVTNFLVAMKNQFPVPLDKKVNIKDYAKKLLSNGDVFSVIDDQVIVGLIGGYNNSNERIGYLSVLVLNPEFRGKGLSKVLLSNYIECAITQGMTVVDLYTNINNQQAVGLYQKFKFEVLDKDIVNNRYYFRKKLD